jgi:hypothetical protein
MNTHIIESMPHNNIPEPIIRSIFHSSNIYLVDVKHRINITNLHEEKNVNDDQNVIGTLGLIDFHGININQHEHMINAYKILQKNQYLSYNHKSKMINEYNNPNLISCMFFTLFPFRIGVLEMANKIIKVSLQMHVKHLLSLDETKYVFSKHHLFRFFVFNIIQHRQVCLGAKLIVSKSSNMNERDL